jgi:hypothetical protein
MSDSYPILWPSAEDKSRYYDNQMNTGLAAMEEPLVGTDSPAIKKPGHFFSFVNG